MGFNLPEIKGDIVFESFPAGPLQCNCSIVGDPVTKRCVVVDPGGDPEKILAFVDENGLVVSDSTRLEPPTSDGSFNQRLIREASEWVFQPAQQEGRAVPSWFPYRIRM